MNVPVGSMVIDTSKEVGATLTYGCRQRDCGKEKMGQVLNRTFCQPGLVSLGLLDASDLDV